MLRLGKLNRKFFCLTFIRKYFILVTTEQMFSYFLDEDGTVTRKPGTGVPTLIQDSNIAIEYLFYPRSMLDLWKVKEELKKIHRSTQLHFLA